MSKPLLKKKRTILDFFKKAGGNKRQKTNKGEAMATSGNGDEPQACTSGSGDAGENNVIVLQESDVSDGEPYETADQGESQGSTGSAIVDSPRIPSKKPTQVKEGSHAWKGIPLKMLDRLTDTSPNLGPLKHTDNHKVLFKTPYLYDVKNKSPPQPYPKFMDKWDQTHVRMPCSNQNEYPGVDKYNKKVVRRRWDMIQEALLGDIPGPYELEERILSYNSRYVGKWRFDVLHKFFQVAMTREERLEFFSNILKKMANLALQMPHLCTSSIPLLQAGRTFSITLSQQQIACLLANAFFCTFPRRNAKTKNSEFSRYPNINFNSLFVGQPSSVKFEKIKCLIHYFKRFFNDPPNGTVTFTRQRVEQMPSWEDDGTILKALHVSSEGTIEDDGFGMLQVDFANMYLGGGVLGHGCVQEEIRFLICPEMLVSRLFTECLNKDECLIMTGCERFSNYEGYASSFEWAGNYVDNTLRDSWGRIQCEVVAIDALVIHDYKSQFQLYQVKRELSKAYCGFLHPDGVRKTLPAVCTGNWGCGAFGGDKQLKALIQLMAAAKAGRDLCYFTFDDEKIRDDIHAIHKFLTEKCLTIGDILSAIKLYTSLYVTQANTKAQLRNIPLFDFIKTCGMKPRYASSDFVTGQGMQYSQNCGQRTSDIHVTMDWQRVPSKTEQPHRLGGNGLHMDRHSTSTTGFPPYATYPHTHHTAGYHGSSSQHHVGYSAGHQSAVSQHHTGHNTGHQTAQYSSQSGQVAQDRHTHDESRPHGASTPSRGQRGRGPPPDTLSLAHL